MTAAIARLAALLLVVGAPAAARGEGVVALSDPRVPQYREALEGAMEALSATPPALLDSLAPEVRTQLKARKPEVVLAVGQKALQIALETAPEIPVVYCMVLGRAAAGSDRVTGVPIEVSGGEQLTRFKQILPGLKRLGVLFDPGVSRATVAEAEAAAKELGVALVQHPVADAKDIGPSATALIDAVDAMWLPADPRLISKDVFGFLLELTSRKRIPLFGFVESFTKAGALASVVPDYRGIGLQAGRLVSDLAKRPPAKRLPVPAVTHSSGALTLNEKAAEKLGIALPADAVKQARSVFK